MAVTAGPFPTSEGYAEFAGKRRSYVNKASFGMKDFRGHGNPDKPSYRYIKNSLSGDTYRVPARDFKEIESYLKKANKGASDGGLNQVQGGLTESYIVSKANGKNGFSTVQSAGDFIDFGFSEGQKNEVETVTCHGGHIAELSYNAKYMLLKVRFAKSYNLPDTVVFFNLPANTAVTLMYLGKNGTMAPPDRNGRERHAVGVEFWNLVRVRGTIHQTRFQFMYDYDSGSVGGAGGDGNFTSEDITRIENVVQEKKPYVEAEIPVPSKRSSTRAIGDYDAQDMDRILSEDGKYKDWFRNLKRNWTASGSSYMLRLAKDAEDAYKKGDWEGCRKALRGIASSGVDIFPEAMSKGGE